MHGTHQLAKKLTSFGRPSARLAEESAGLRGKAEVAANAGTGLPIIPDSTLVSGGFASRQTSAPTSKTTNATGMNLNNLRLIFAVPCEIHAKHGRQAQACHRAQSTPRRAR